MISDPKTLPYLLTSREMADLFRVSPKGLEHMC